MKKLLILNLFLFITIKGWAPINPIQMQKEISLTTKSYLKEQHEKQIVSILQTIRLVESRNNYHIRGLSGEYGAYQFTIPTWNRLCRKYKNKTLDITIPANQDTVARAHIEYLLSKGYDIKQIASIWNSGSPRYAGRIGINRYGVKYNVPKYVDNFINVYGSI